jgi:hypothetical protein
VLTNRRASAGSDAAAESIVAAESLTAATAARCRRTTLTGAANVCVGFDARSLDRDGAELRVVGMTELAGTPPV